MPRQGGCCDNAGNRNERRRQAGCCIDTRRSGDRGEEGRQGGCCNGPRREVDIDERTMDRGIAFLTRSLRRLKTFQCLILTFYFFNSVVSARPGQALVPILACLTLFLTLGSTSARGVGGDRSRGFLILSITSDSICIAMQLVAVIGLFVVKPLVRCFKTGAQGGRPCSIVWVALFLSNALIIMFIHSIVRAAILLFTLRCQSRRQPPISTPEEDPPAYPTLNTDFPLRTPVQTSASDVDGVKSPNGGHGDTSAPSPTTLTDVIVTPGSPAGSDAGGDAGEDRPLLY